MYLLNKNNSNQSKSTVLLLISNQPSQFYLFINLTQIDKSIMNLFHWNQSHSSSRLSPCPPQTPFSTHQPQPQGFSYVQPQNILKNQPHYQTTTNGIDLDRSRETGILTSRLTASNARQDRDHHRNSLMSPRLEESRKSNPMSLASTRCRLESSQISSTMHSFGSIRQTSSVQEKTLMFAKNNHLQQNRAKFNLCPKEQKAFLTHQSKQDKLQFQGPKQFVAEKRNQTLNSVSKPQRQNKPTEKQPVPQVQTTLPKAIVDVKPKLKMNEIIKRAADKVVEPLSILPPFLLLKTVTPHKVVKSNSQLPVIGMYYSNEKDKKYVLREFSKASQPKPISMKIVGILPQQLIPTQIIKINMNKNDIEYQEQNEESLFFSRKFDKSRRLEQSQSLKGTRLSDNITISVYKSPDVVIFAPQVMPGQKLKKNHVKRITVEGKLVENPKEEEVIQVVQGIEIIEERELTPVEKYFALKKKLNPSGYTSLSTEGNESSNSEILICTVESNGQKQHIELATKEIIMEAIETKIHLSSSGNINSDQCNIDVEVEEYELINYQQYETSMSSYFDQPAATKLQATIISQTQFTNQSESSEPSSRYVSKVLPADLLSDLRNLNSKEGLPETNFVWYRLSA